MPHFVYIVNKEQKVCCSCSYATPKYRKIFCCCYSNQIMFFCRNIMLSFLEFILENFSPIHYSILMVILFVWPPTRSLFVGCVGILINWCMMVLQINNTTLLRDYHICNSSTTDESHLDYRFIHFCTALFSNEMMKSVSGFNKQLRNAVLCIFILSSTTAGHEVKMQKQN